MSEVLIKRWKRGYEFYLAKDYMNALQTFELIELSCLDKSSIPKEISFNRILTLIALEEHDHTVEVGSKLLRSSLGPFFLFALGIHQEVVNPEQSLLSFKKCLLSLKDSKKVEMEGNYWTITKFMVYINLAIMSNIAEDEKLANLYLLKAQEMSEDEDSKNIAKVYLEKGLKGVRCIGFPKDFCIPPVGYSKDQTDSSKDDIEGQKDVVNEPNNSVNFKKLNTQHDVGDKKYHMLPTPPLENEFKNQFSLDNDSNSMYGVPDKIQDDTENPQFYKYFQKSKFQLKSQTSELSIPSICPPARMSSKIYKSCEKEPETPVSPTISGDFFSETAYVQLFGIWRPFLVLLDGKTLKLCDEKVKSQIHLEIRLDRFCKIEPATDSFYKKLHLFRLVVDTDEYLFGLENLQTSLDWISKIMKTSLNLPTTPKEVKLLTTGLGREPFSLDK